MRTGERRFSPSPLWHFCSPTFLPSPPTWRYLTLRRTSSRSVPCDASTSCPLLMSLIENKFDVYNHCVFLFFILIKLFSISLSIFKLRKKGVYSKFVKKFLRIPWFFQGVNTLKNLFRIWRFPFLIPSFLAIAYSYFLFLQLKKISFNNIILPNYIFSR